MKGTREPTSYSHYYPLLQSCLNLQSVQAPVQCHQPSLHARWSPQPLQNSRIICSNPTGNLNPKPRTETAHTELLLAACITVQNTRAFLHFLGGRLTIWSYIKEGKLKGRSQSRAEGWAPNPGVMLLHCYCPGSCCLPTRVSNTARGISLKLVLCLARIQFVSTAALRGSASHVGRRAGFRIHPFPGELGRANSSFGKLRHGNLNLHHQTAWRALRGALRGALGKCMQ